MDTSGKQTTQAKKPKKGPKGTAGGGKGKVEAAAGVSAAGDAPRADGDVPPGARDEVSNICLIACECG